MNSLRGLEKSHWFIHCRQKLEKISFSWASLPITQFPGDTESKPFLRVFPDRLTFCWINWHILYQIYMLHLSTQARNDFTLNRVFRAPRELWKLSRVILLLKSSCLPQKSPPCLTASPPGYKWWGHSKSQRNYSLTPEIGPLRFPVCALSQCFIW